MNAELRGTRLARVRGVYVIADDAPHWPHPMERVVEAAARVGVGAVQLRMKQLRDGEALARARALVARARAAGVLVFVNDRYDLADLAGADGVHLGDGDLAPQRIAAEVRARLLIGGSTHTLEQVRAVRDWPLDYIGFGPLFATGSKVSVHTPRGLDLLGAAARGAGRPVVAIGGIDGGRIAGALRAGAAAAAVISAVQGAADPESALRELCALCEAAGAPVP